MAEPIFMKPGMYAMAPESNLNGVLHIIPPIGLCLVFRPIASRQRLGKNTPIVARQRVGRNVTTALNAYATTEELLS
jgi:hypothetical protein